LGIFCSIIAMSEMCLRESVTVTHSGPNSCRGAAPAHRQAGGRGCVVNGGHGASLRHHKAVTQRKGRHREGAERLDVLAQVVGEALGQRVQRGGLRLAGLRGRWRGSAAAAAAAPAAPAARPHWREACAADTL
jgi:hypothetical protein